MRAEQFLKTIRIRSDNVDANAIKDDEILAYLNDAQDRLQSLIMQEHPESDIFSMQAFIYLRSGEDSYSVKEFADINGNKVPWQLFVETCISMVEISQNFGAIQASDLRSYATLADFPIMGDSGYTYLDQSTGKTYRWQGAAYIEILASTMSYNYAGTWLPLPQVSPKERTVGFGYFVRGDRIIICPLPQTMNVVLRVTGMKRLLDIDKRRGKIGTITSLAGVTTLGLTGIPSDTTFDMVDQITIVDSNGNVMQYTDPSTGKVTYYAGLNVSSFSTPNLLLDVATLPSTLVGCYVVYGDYASSHCGMNDICNRYLIESTVARIFMRDSSRDISSQIGLISSIEQEIKQCFASLGNDAVLIPINTTDYLYY